MVTFPDAVALLIDYLNDNIVEPVVHRIPNPRPATFVTVRRTGGPKRNLVTDQAQVTVESWAASDEDAHDLAQEVRALLNDLGDGVKSLDGVAVYRCDELAGPADLPDPLSDQARFTQSFSVALRGT
jgi:hypothetical protein